MDFFHSCSLRSSPENTGHFDISQCLVVRPYPSSQFEMPIDSRSAHVPSPAGPRPAAAIVIVVITVHWSNAHATPVGPAPLFCNLLKSDSEERQPLYVLRIFRSHKV